MIIIFTAINACPEYKCHLALDLFVQGFMLYQQYQSFISDGSQIHVSWTVFNQYLTSPLS